MLFKKRFNEDSHLAVVVLTALRTNHFAGAPCTGLQPDEWDQFHPSAGNAYKVAKKLCEGCNVQQKCLEWVLSFEHADERYGVFGGLTARERERLFAGAPTRNDVECLEGHPRVEGEQRCTQCRVDAWRRRAGSTLTGPVKAKGESWESIAKRLRKSHPASDEYRGNSRYFGSKDDNE